MMGQNTTEASGLRLLAGTKAHVRDADAPDDADVTPPRKFHFLRSEKMYQNTGDER
ncbi:hypothetical protein GRAN_1293 [Granulicella sibirica]|uniref:Uncharacterized protein n=1 Tax=Granulicella sibirica TaxID=2479048 RepID=A0A4Q0T2W8_9BACT|nr:hypothetical protein GRAN_1293 [Granulicella sibirica]